MTWEAFLSRAIFSYFLGHSRCILSAAARYGNEKNNAIDVFLKTKSASKNPNAHFEAVPREKTG